MDNFSHLNGNMVQYGVWPNCNNACAFCLREERIPYRKKIQLHWLDKIKRNIHYIDWGNKFSHGISLLGGELYYITDEELQNSFLELVDTIIEVILVKHNNSHIKYSSVTNGIYDPVFLYKVIDKIVERVGLDCIDLNFSYDLDHRYKNKEDEALVLKNIVAFHKRYDYRVGVQMILTQSVINKWKNGEFEVSAFIDNEIKGNNFSFLYPHPINTGKKLENFYFKREDFIDFMLYLKRTVPDVYISFLHSVRNSCSFKYTGLRDRSNLDLPDDTQPILSDGKNILSIECGHSTLYRCYSDSNECILCDLKILDGEAFL